MQPRPQSRDAFELSQLHIDQLLNPAHELIQPTGRFEAAYAGRIRQRWVRRATKQ